MNRITLVSFVSILCLALTTAAAAQEEAADESALESEPAAAAEPVASGPSTHVIGANLSLGMATALVENCSNCSIRFAGGGGAHYNLYLADVFGLHAGIAFTGRGLKASAIANQTDQDEQKIKIVYMDIPLGIKLRFSSFQLALGVSLDFALTGKVENPDHDFTDAEWDVWARRFNLGAWIGLGWAIHAGPIDIIPGFSWNMHILDENTAGGAFGFVRPMNLMIDLGVEFGL